MQVTRTYLTGSPGTMHRLCQTDLFFVLHTNTFSFMLWPSADLGNAVLRDSLYITPPGTTYHVITTVIKHIKCHAGLDPASRPILDSGFRRNDGFDVYCCRSNICFLSKLIECVKFIVVINLY